MTSHRDTVQAIFAGQRLPLRKAAPFLAASGIPVYPCVEVGKIPRLPHGLLDASADARQVERWWKRWPEANIGLPTGASSGFDVVDVDVRVSGSGYDAFHRAVSVLGLDTWMMRVLTPSGGMHFYYPSDPSRIQRNWVSAKTHVDFRGSGGGVILPPSLGLCEHDQPEPYTVVETRTTGHPLDADALRRFLDPGWDQQRFATRLSRIQHSDAREDALKSWVATRSEGERNMGLFWAACRMAEAGRPFEITLDTLSSPAQDCGLLDREIIATIRSAYRHTTPAVSHVREEPSRPFVTSRASVMVL